jgi:hypothetical protein
MDLEAGLKGDGKTRFPPGFKLWTFQPLAIRYGRHICEEDVVTVYRPLCSFKWKREKRKYWIDDVS